jgi:hypothetical protein
MRLQQWTSRKSNHLLAALTLALWWGSYSFPPHRAEISLASGDSQIDRDAADVSTGERRLVIYNGRRIAPVRRTNKLPLPGKSQVCGALNLFFLSLSRKPRPGDIPAPVTIFTWFYPVRGSDRHPLKLVDKRQSFYSLYAYLHHCALLI